MFEHVIEVGLGDLDVGREWGQSQRNPQVNKFE